MGEFDMGRTHFELGNCRTVRVSKWRENICASVEKQHADIPGDSVEGLLSVSSSLGVSNFSR